MRRPLNSNDPARLRSRRNPNGAGRRDDVTTAAQSQRRRLGHGVDGQHVVRHRMARQIDPTPAALHMAPALEVHTLGVVPKEEVAAPGLIAGVEPGPLNVRCAAAYEFVLVARPAADTGYSHHGD